MVKDADKPRCVLIIVENLPSPFDRRVWQEATTLQQNGYGVSIICPTGKGYEKKFEEIDGIHIYRHNLHPQRHLGDAELPGTPDEVKQFLAGGFRMSEEELGDGAGMPRQQFSVRPTVHSMLNLLDDLRGGEIPVPERRAGTDAEQACDLGDLQSQVAAEQEVANDPHTGIIPLTLPEKPKGGLQNVCL